MRAALAPAYASVTSSSHHAHTERDRAQSRGERVARGRVQPRVELVEGKVEGRAAAEVVHGDDRDSLHRDQRDEGRRSSLEAHQTENRKKTDKEQEVITRDLPGGPCPP